MIRWGMDRPLRDLVLEELDRLIIRSRAERNAYGHWGLARKVNVPGLDRHLGPRCTSRPDGFIAVVGAEGEMANQARWAELVGFPCRDLKIVAVARVQQHRLPALRAPRIAELESKPLSAELDARVQVADLHRDVMESTAADNLILPCLPPSPRDWRYAREWLCCADTS